jgi:putative phosphoribosyl transferase
MSLFRDRQDAGRRLARALSRYKDQDPVVLALPRGGVPVAAEVASALGAPLDLVLVRKIGLPYQPELAMGAVVDGGAPIVIRNDDVIAAASVGDDEFDIVRDRELAEIERRRQRYIKERPRAGIAGRTAIVVDDGIATGATMKAALRAVRKRGARQVVLAVPVAPVDSIEDLRDEVDAVVCLETPDVFGAIGYFYDDFRQVSDDEVIAILHRLPPKRSSSAAQAARKQFPGSGQ